MANPESDFEGRAAAMPEPLARGAALYRVAPIPEDGRPAGPVRHARGYAEFAGFAAQSGEVPEQLAADPQRLITFLNMHAVELGEGTLRAAAVVFLGNTIVQLRPDAQWRTFAEHPPTVGNRTRQFEPAALCGAFSGADDDRRAQIAALLQQWAQEDESDNETIARPQPTLPPPEQNPYIRPHLPTSSYFSRDGKIIAYGRRWGAGGPPPDSYSAETHLERFAGLHTVAQALIRYLGCEYEVDVSHGPAHAADLLTVRTDVLQATRVTPAGPLGAPLTFVFTGYPGVAVHAGVLHDFHFPPCGCDACDETVESGASELENLVLGVAAGGYAERYPTGRRRWAQYALTAPDGSAFQSGGGDVGPVPQERLRYATDRLRLLPAGWAPWPLKRRGDEV